MRVFLINVVCGVGSTGRICLDIARSLENDGHTVRIAYGRGEAPADCRDIAVKVGTPMNIALHIAAARLFDAAGFASAQATEKLVEEIKAFSPDVINLHNLHGYYLNIRILFDYLKTFNGQIVWTLHDCWPFTGHCAHYAAAGCSQWIKGCRSCPELRQYPSCITAGNVNNNYFAKKEVFAGLRNLTIIAPSYWLAGEIKKSFLMEYPVNVIHNGVDLSIFKPRESTVRQRLGIGDRRMLLGVAGVWTERKGLQDFVRLNDMLNQNEVLVLVGLTKRQIRRLPAGIIGVKNVNSAVALAEIYSAADVFVNLTYEDTFPTVNLEALACGTPVVAYKTCGSVEALTENTGIAVQAGNLAAAYAAIENILQRRVSRNEIAAFTDVFSKNNAINCYKEIYQKVRNR